MINPIEKRLAKLGIELAEPSAPVANYVSFVRSGNQVYIAGQTSVSPDGAMLTGRVGQDLDLETGRLAARYCGIRLLAQMKAACGGDLTKISRVVKLGGFVCAMPEASGPIIPQIINGCSDLMVEVFGDEGRHARFAVGSPSLPRDAAVEIDAIVELRN